MRVVPVLLIAANITEGQQIELCLSTIASGIYREQYRPGNQTADEANDYQQFEETKVKICIERVVVKPILVRRRPESLEPAEFLIWKLLPFLPDEEI